MEARVQTIVGSFSPKLIGAGFMLLWAMLFSTAMALAKSLSPEVDSVVLLFMRYFFGLLFFTPILIQSGKSSVKSSRPLLQLLRVMFVIGAMGCTYYAYRNLPLAFATSLGMTGPLFTTVLSIILLRDSVPLAKWGMIILGYVGVLVMVRPGFVPVNFPVWVELAANLLAASAIVTTKVLSRTDSSVTTMFYTNTVTTFVAGILAYIFWKTPSGGDLLTLVLIGGIGVFSQFSSVNALKYANPSYLAPFEYTRLIFAVPVGLFFFDEIPSVWTFLGSLIIIAATYGLTRLELTSQSQQSG